MSEFHIQEIKIKNFRNFENIEIKTNKKNIIIGINDVGKTNLLYALKLVFDYKIRNVELLESDFHKKNIESNFEIFISIDIGVRNEQNNFYDILISEIENLRKSEDGTQTIFNIKLIGNYENGIEMYWNIGTISNDEDMELIPPVGVNRNKIDNIFEVFDIPPYNEIDKKFKEFKQKILKDLGEDKNDRNIISEIKEEQEVIKEKINQLKFVKEIENNISNTMKDFNVSYKIKVASTLGLKNLHDDLSIFTVQNDDSSEEIYPTAGDGRRKTILYSMYLYDITQESKKIPIILLEEPENHLFIINQISLSKNILEGEIFCNVFLSTHSPELMYYLADQTNVIRIERENSKTISKSAVLSLPEDFKSLKNKVQKDIARAIFSKKILLVEGYSEKILFDYILDQKITNVEKRADIYVLNIIGVNFEPYYNFFKNLGIDVRVKTDNDLKKQGEKTELLGINRVLGLLNKEKYSPCSFEIKAKKEEKIEDKKRRKNITEKIYDKLKKNDRMLEFQRQYCYLSRVDFENDLAEVLCTKDEKKEEMVNFLQNSKWHNLFDEEYHKLIFSEESIEKIVNSEYFRCLKDLID
ncbi:DUF2813 domain-containing protein [Fusobacterium varium]|uniref:ATP-dependent nuclease n=1 Tax=Fusobacterium varium TaxID=856 RepID=UPI000E53A0A5|nr:AAA family ATPase [Fusobacterium varium]RHG37885.1 DUF2813 domain-containing protein [Fusobacterium varium]